MRPDRRRAERTTGGWQSERTGANRADGRRQPGIAAVQKWPGERQNPVDRQFKGLDNRLRANILPSGKYRQGIGKYHKLEYEGDMMKRNLIFGIAVAACLAAAGYYVHCL